MAMTGSASGTTVALRSSAGFMVIAATVIGSAIGFLDATVVNVAVPAIGDDLGAGVASLQWILTSYLVTVAALLIVAGDLADRYGRRRVLLTGLAVTLVASLVCAVAPDTGTLVAGRILQGVGGALAVPSSLALLNAALRNADRALGIGIWAALATLATTFGPYFGGWLVDHSSWRWLFLLNVPLAALAALVLSRVPESRDTGSRGPVDVTGSVLAAAGLGGAVYALNDGAANGWGRSAPILWGVLGLVCLVGMVLVERRVANPMLKLRLFRSRQFNAINAGTLLLYGGLGAAGYLVTLQLELGLHYSAASTGAALIPGSVVFLLLSPVSGWLVARVGPRRLMAVGAALVGIGYLFLAALGPGSEYLTGVLPGALLQGLGLGLCVTPLTAAVLAAVPNGDLGEASAVNNAVSRLGGVVFIALLPALAGAPAGLADTLAAVYVRGMVIAAVLCLLSAAVAAVFVSDAKGRSPRFAPPPPHPCIPQFAQDTVSSDGP